jgi:hypothetical protein
MTWHDKHIWVRQPAKSGREALAASVEEIAGRNPLEDDEWDEKDVLPTQETSLVPPRLHLQSRLIPAVGAKPTQAIPASQEPTQPPLTNPVAAPQVAKQGQRLGGRSTKVRLQAVRPDQRPELSTDRLSTLDSPNQQDRAVPTAQVRSAKTAGGRGSSTPRSEASASVHSWPRPLGGRGMIKRDQDAVTIPNAAITERSVVHVMLAGNPGPVVVQYILLHPRMGFTVHLSAPATADAPFNYALWPF